MPSPLAFDLLVIHSTVAEERMIIRDTRAAVYRGCDRRWKTNMRFCSFGVFDGHGGRECAEFLKNNITARVRSCLQSHHLVEDALKEAFSNVDNQFLRYSDENNIAETGSTAVVCLVTKTTIYCANTGDSRAILCRRAKTLQLSRDHKPNRSGGSVIFNRVMGRLGVSRAFGDASLKKYVTAEPEVTSFPLTVGDDFLILACDGLWDVVDNDAVAKIVRSKTSSQGIKEAAQALTSYAVRCGSNDNVTVIVVQLPMISA
ncbi:hypothetical protein GUITHDRAFT_147660 [Guillardia theta CCMP2712]|uniref:PPM-type phosphatase domain-containing protein n=1 Tax=Guillardia theta (strain CCMP2712) TaxID=905079 RepID=L1ICM5_GUITC|nr:hypothetical protein GUITHDRAFT_147660 [Guillardia theta CCMP2712]EKX33817.1 hypothetical protein GUITHDRAFT_147660 [Guillardia theta CCMP2712]|eukprot:XP_005820797.1 hypothetical protein GUITHDRAFT_147660 [Guillardia theta CCMP2712]